MYDLALKITEFFRDTDVYGWDDAYCLEDDGFEKAIEDTYELITQFDDSIVDYLDELMTIDDYHDRALELKTQLLKEWY